MGEVEEQGEEVANDGEDREEEGDGRVGIIIYLAATVIFINQRIYQRRIRTERERERER